MPDLDILYLSEIDPTWNNDELNVFLYPESLLLANPIALAACLADVAAVEIREAIDPLFFCVGSWRSSLSRRRPSPAAQRPCRATPAFSAAEPWRSCID